MAAKKKAAEQFVLDEDYIIDHYMQYVLANNKIPGNVFQFCQEHNIAEPDFYSFYSSFKAIRMEIWVKFFDNALLTIAKEPEYFAYSRKDKLLTLYFTLFEIFTLNRTYIYYSLKDNGRGIKNTQDLTRLRERFKDHAIHNLKPDLLSKMQKASKIGGSAFGESVWIQFLFILKFWIDDTSPSFEKTDIMIEKSVNTADTLFDSAPLEKLFDLGKFLWKERKTA